MTMTNDQAALIAAASGSNMSTDTIKQRAEILAGWLDKREHERNKTNTTGFIESRRNING